MGRGQNPSRCENRDGSNFLTKCGALLLSKKASLVLHPDGFDVVLEGTFPLTHGLALCRPFGLCRTTTNQYRIVSHVSLALTCARDTKLCSTRLKRLTHKFVICSSSTKASKRHGVFSPFLRRAFASQTECIYHTAIEQRRGRGVSNSEDIDSYEDVLRGPQHDRLDSPAQSMVFQDLWLRHVEISV